MDKSAIKSFAIEARKILMKSAITQAGFYGVSKDGCSQPTQKGAGFEVYRTIAGTDNRIFGDDIKRREKLVKAVEEKGFDQVIEETAYTWFNRLIAIRFMEVNGYLPTRTRVLSSETGSNTPDLMSQYMDVDLDMTMDELEKVQACVRENRYDDAFALLFVKQCNALNEILPELFEKTTDYMELLLKLSYTSDGVVRMLVDTIPESNFDIEQEGQIEIIGWMYQYYISKRREEVIDPLYGKTIKKEDIPAATQLFTTDWVVRYMVDNSLGRYWIERNPESKLVEKLQFFVTPKDGNINYIDEKIYPTDMTFFDPCMGSGHILVYAFEVLMEIYRECGYSDRDAALSIVQNNLYGMDIDKRAYQLAYFAVMMKVRSYNRRALTQVNFNNLAVCEESNSIDKFNCEGLTTDKEQNEIGEYLVEVYKDAQELGTLQMIKKNDYKSFAEYLFNIESNTEQFDIYTIGWLNTILPKMLQFAKQAHIMSQRFAVVCTNPPYMNKMEGKLKDFVVNNYKPYAGDLFSVFAYRNFWYCKENGYSALMTPNVWMFIKTYENLRKYIIDNKTIISLIQMAKGAFFKEATVDICTFILKNSFSEEKGLYFRLEEFKGDMDVQKEKILHALNDKNCGYFYETSDNYFTQIPGCPIAYWVSEKMLEAFSKGRCFAGDTKKGVLTGKNDVFLRLWYEVNNKKIGFNLKNHEEMCLSKKKWFPVTSGGLKRKWYGNFDTIVNLENDGMEIKNTVENYRLRDPRFYMREAVTWTEVSSGIFSCRYVPQGVLFGNGGPVSFFNNNDLYYHLGLLNSNTTMTVMEYLAPTVNYGPEQISKIPLVLQQESEIVPLVKQNIDYSQSDWDSFEISWDFKVHPLVSLRISAWEDESLTVKLESVYKMWEMICEDRFNKLKENEEKLNRIFIEIYGLQGELTPSVENKDVTVRKADFRRDIKSLISYAVGCMFGRYSLDNEGVIYAGGEWDNSKYTTFNPDNDNSIPITDEEYFEDDIVGLLCEWIKTVYGDKRLEDNLDFIAKALGNKGTTAREVIRNYFLNDFMKDHMKIYQKRPIYWMFDSGKQNGFKCLTYMHRYDKDTVGRVRSDYLRKSQEAIEAALKNAEYTIQNSSSAIDKATATKKRDKYIKQLSEIRTYFQALSHMALQRIDIDLDDGVKANYEKFQNIEIVDENGKKQKINLLTKI